jgi:riboflavin kinase/FMN adenylyltransferase
MTFEPHPLVILRPGPPPPRLTTAARRIELLRAAGADEVEMLAPTKDLLSLEPEAFIAQLVERHRPAAIVEGRDFRFGRARTGDVETLRRLEARCGYRTIVIDEVEVRLTDQTIVRASSSLVRGLVAAGRVRDAAAILGRPHEVCGTVVAGARRGRDLGMPTANLDVRDQLLPADGVYAGVAWCPGGARFAAAISVGTNPTFGADERRCEAHLLEWPGPLDDYGWSMRLEITTWLRDQLRYDDVGALTDQMRRDVARVPTVER